MADIKAPTGRHKNDIYGDNPDSPGANPAIPAATVVLLREAPDLRVLMLHKTSKIAFGGMWVFPGGRIDPEDYPADGDSDVAARNAAAREAHEEAGIHSSAEAFVWFAHWTPPPGTPRRFATWFFAARADSHDVSVDGGEIQDHEWLNPAEALTRHAAGEIDLAPPTWVTLHQLSRFSSVDGALAQLGSGGVRTYETHVGKRADGARVAMWSGDAGYETMDADAEGDRHRLVMTSGGFVFENTVLDY
jgi:8-oxo-dGTP pyrophosphatase MutT (NUDIX family)